MGVYQGLELANGLRIFLPKNITEFWAYLYNNKLFKGLDETLPVSENDPDLSSMHLELLNLLNVKYILSKVPISNKKIDLIDYTNGIGNVNKYECPVMIKGKRILLD